MTIQEAKEFYLKYRMYPGFHIARDHIDNLDKMKEYMKLNISSNTEKQWYEQELNSQPKSKYLDNSSSWFAKR